MTTRRNPDKTREDLLQAGFEEIHHSGFRAADVPKILAAAGVTKGALYHHFGSKKGLGFAVIDEVVREMVLDEWIRPLSQKNPIDALISTLTEGLENSDELAACGCPLNNLAQELSSVDDEFRQRISSIYKLWRQGLAKHLARGQREGTVRPEIDPEDTAAFLVASCEGSMGLAKGSQDGNLLETCVRGIVQYLETLRPGATLASVAELSRSAAAQA